MLSMKHNCESCNHKGICKYEEELLNLEMTVSNIDIHDPFHINVTCNKYESGTLYNVRTPFTK